MIATIPEYPWYGEIPANVPLEDAPLEQGDLVLKYPVIQPQPITKEEEDNVFDVDNYDIIIMSQSCDLAAKKLELVMVCPFNMLNTLSTEFNTVNKKNQLRKGQIEGVHLLNKCHINGELDYLVVDFRSAFSIPINLLDEFVSKQGERQRLLPPYREHLAQSFTRFFIRVGLPSGITKFAE